MSYGNPLRNSRVLTYLVQFNLEGSTHKNYDYKNHIFWEWSVGTQCGHLAHYPAIVGKMLIACLNLKYIFGEIYKDNVRPLMVRSAVSFPSHPKA